MRNVVEIELVMNHQNGKDRRERAICRRASEAQGPREHDVSLDRHVGTRHRGGD